MFKKVKVTTGFNDSLLILWDGLLLTLVLRLSKCILLKNVATVKNTVIFT